MKTLFLHPAIIAASLLFPSAVAFAQAPVTPAAETPKSQGLVASLAPANETSKVHGNIRFSSAGDAVNVMGRIEGLDANKKYRIEVILLDSGPPSEESADGPQATPPRKAGPPVAPTPPVPPAGQPDGTSRAGASGGGTQGSSHSGSRRSVAPPNDSAPSTGDLGFITADSGGNANVNATLRNVDLSDGSKGISGHTFVVGSVSSEPSGPSLTVASAVITPKEQSGPAKAQ